MYVAKCVHPACREAAVSDALNAGMPGVELEQLRAGEVPCLLAAAAATGEPPFVPMPPGGEEMAPVLVPELELDPPPDLAASPDYTLYTMCSAEPPAPELVVAPELEPAAYVAMCVHPACRAVAVSEALSEGADASKLEQLRAGEVPCLVIDAPPVLESAPVVSADALPVPDPRLHSAVRTLEAHLQERRARLAAREQELQQRELAVTEREQQVQARELELAKRSGASPAA